MKNRGQAAMEFMMTYGWALLVVLIAIGALAFFGVLNPSGFLPNTCTLAPGFSCSDFKVSAATGYSIILQNGIGEDIIAGSSLKIDEGGTSTTCDVTMPNAGIWADGASFTFSAVAPAGCTLTAGSKFKADLILTYTPSGGIAHSKVGQLVSGVEA